MSQKSIRKMAINEKATIVAILAKGEMGRRIRDMGLIPGADIQIIGRAPLNDPIAIRLNGFTLALRNKEADYIIVSTAQQY